MTEAHAWRRLAEVLDATPLNVAHRFLCWWLRPPLRPTGISKSLAKRMNMRLLEAMAYHTSAAYGDWANYFIPHTTEAENRRARVLVCLLFAEQAEDEART